MRRRFSACRSVAVRPLLIAVCAVLVGSFSNAQTDTTPPSVTSVTPSMATRNVALHPTLQIVFSEPLDPNGVTSSTIQLRDTRNVLVTGTVTYNLQGNVATFVPSGPLLPTRRYTAMVVGGASGVTDVAGNALAASFTWTFVTTVEAVRIAAGDTHSVAVDDAGQVWTWGSGAQQRGTTFDGRIPGIVAAASGKA